MQYEANTLSPLLQVVPSHANVSSICPAYEIASVGSSSSEDC